MNPVLRGDLRVRLNSPKALTVYTIFLGLLGVLAVLSLPPELGRTDEIRQEGLLLTFLIVETVLVAYFASACASGEIGIEEEKSIDDLATAAFSARTIGIGKVLSSGTFALLLVLLAVPVVCVVAGIRGDPLANLVRAGMVAVLFGGAMGALGALYQALFESEFTRSFVHWLTLLTLVVGTAALPEPWSTISPVRAVAIAVRFGLRPAPVVASLGYIVLALIASWGIQRRVEVIRRDVRAA